MRDAFTPKWHTSQGLRIISIVWANIQPRRLVKNSGGHATLCTQQPLTKSCTFRQPHTHKHIYLWLPYLLFWDNKYHSRQSRTSSFHHHTLQKFNPTHEVALLHNIGFSSLAALVGFVPSRNAVNRRCLLPGSWIYPASANALSESQQ